MNRRLALLLLGLVLPLAWTLGRPPDFDEVNFLTLARGAVADPWRPHAVLINWQGVTQPAFDVLSNPPGIAWWLAPVVHAPVWAQRLWMLPWLLPALWGARRLGQRFLGDVESGAFFLLTAPIVMLSTTALLPDLPLFALTLAGMAGFLDAVEADRNVAGWAAVLGSAAIFRYSGVALWPLVLLWPFLLRRRLAPALAVVVPIGLLALHDLSAYGSVHLLAMGKFQSVANTPADWGHKAVAAVTMLGGAAALPVYRWRGPHLAAAAVGAAAAAPWGLVAAGFGALGGAALAPVVLAFAGGESAPEAGATPGPARRSSGMLPKAPARPTPERVFLGAWALLGFAFLLTLRFTAARYWLPFLPPVLLLLPTPWPRLRLAVGFVLGAMLVTDDALHARGDAALAARVAETGTGRFTGHWGWQGALEAAGWTALDEGEAVAPGERVAIPTQAWPQRVDVRCDHVRWEGHAWPPFPWLPRGYSAEAGANVQADWIAGPPPVRTVIPWWFARDAYESARVCEE